MDSGFTGCLSRGHFRVHAEPGGTELPNSVAPVSVLMFWFSCKRGLLKLICIYLWQRNVPKTHMYLTCSQIWVLTRFMGEGNLGRRMQVLSSEEEKELAALMRSQKMFQSHLEGQKGQQTELISLEVLCALRTPSLSQPLVMMMKRARTGRSHPLRSHLQQ
jgi:hypothetical protein